MRVIALRTPRRRPAICTILVASVLLSLAGRSDAQPPQTSGLPFEGASVAVPTSLQREISKQFRLDRFSVQQPVIRTHAGGELRTSVLVGDRLYTLSLHPGNVRAPGFRLLLDDGTGHLREAAPPPSKTFSGTLIDDPGGVAAASWENGQLTAVIRLGNGEIWSVQPVAAQLPTAPQSWHVVFRDIDAEAGTWSCGSTEHQHAIEGVGTTAPEDIGLTAGTGPLFVAELAFEADFEFFQANGSSVAATVTDIESVLNGVNVIYQNGLELTHRITTVLVRTAEPDPYTATNSNLLLDEFIAEWISNQGAIIRDVAHLMTGKILDGTIIGIAEVQSVCDALRAYGLSQSRFSVSMPDRVALTAHELGHSWAAVHCDGEVDCSLMCSTLGACTGNISSFGATATQAITAYRGNLILFVGCLDVLVPKLELVAADSCLQTGATTTVTLRMSDLGLFEAAGFQAFLSFDPTRFSFVSGVYTNSPFGVHLIDPIVAIGGEIDVAAGIDPIAGQMTTTANADLVILTFQALTDACGGTVVAFRGSAAPTGITDTVGTAASGLVTVDTPSIIIDGTPPGITCPGDVAVNADAGGCTAMINPGIATTTDLCDAAPTMTARRSDGLALTDAYPAGTTTITWQATDSCGNVQQCPQEIIVSPFNQVVLDVALSPMVETPITRCITFELLECGGPAPAVVDQEITFTNGLASGVSVLAACGSYSCITARNKLHTLRRTDTDDFGINGTIFTADFTDRSSVGGDDDSLIGGNLNDNDHIDVFDFGALIGQWGINYGTGDTNCTGVAPHADISGDGLVFTADFTFILAHFLKSSDPPCCGQPLQASGPVTEISVLELQRLGQWDAAYGDLNHDGWLDLDDMAAFLHGVRPRRRDSNDAQLKQLRRQRPLRSGN